MKKKNMKEGVSVWIRLWHCYTSARSSILIAPMSDCYLSAISLACFFSALRYSSLRMLFSENGFFFPESKTAQNQPVWKTIFILQNMKKGSDFFNYSVFPFQSGSFRHESLSRTLTLINIYTLFILPLLNAVHKYRTTTADSFGAIAITTSKHNS